MKARLLLILCVLSFCSLSLKAQVKETILCDNFADNSSGWTEGSIMYDYIAYIQSGTYFLEFQKNQGSHIFDIPVKMDLTQNFFFETSGKITQVGKQAGAAFGIVWGKGKGGYLTFALSEDGRFYVRRIAGRTAEFLLKPTRTKFYKPNGVNTLRVQSSETQMMFFINNKYVGHLPLQQAFGTNAGLILYGRQRSEIYNFGAYGTKNYDVLPNYHASLKVSYFEIEDGFDNRGEHLGNGDCKVQPGETVQLAVTVRNVGKGACGKLNARFYAINDYVTIIDQDVLQRISGLAPSQSQTFSLKFRVGSNCGLDKLGFKLDITNDSSLLAESIPLSVPLYTRISPINKDASGKISFTVNVKEQNTDDINSFFPITLQSSRDVAAVMVGVESYATMGKAIYATNDAKIMRQSLIKVMNVPQGNVIAVSNANATLARISNILRFGGELSNKGARNVIFYFSGLGICEPGKHDPYIMLYDSRDNDIKGTCYSVRDIVSQLQEVVSGNVICFFETSFACVDRRGNPASGVAHSAFSYCTYPIVTDNRTCIMYASGNKVYNPVMERTSHGLFTHYLLSALQDFGKNRNTLDMKSLFDFINQNIDADPSFRNLSLQPRMDCINRDGLKLLR